MDVSPVATGIFINFTFTFSPNGTLSSEIISDSIYVGESNEMGASSGTQENTSNSSDFTNTRQVYNITTEGESEIVTINFNTSFTEFTISQEGEMLTLEKQ